MHRDNHIVLLGGRIRPGSHETLFSGQWPPLKNGQNRKRTSLWLHSHGTLFNGDCNIMVSSGMQQLLDIMDKLLYGFRIHGDQFFMATNFSWRPFLMADRVQVPYRFLSYNSHEQIMLLSPKS